MPSRIAPFPRILHPLGSHMPSERNPLLRNYLDLVDVARIAAAGICGAAGLLLRCFACGPKAPERENGGRGWGRGVGKTLEERRKRGAGRGNIG
jgi:hypothetical protein